MGYLINAMVLTLFMGSGTYFLLMYLKGRFLLDLQETKGYFMLLMLVSTLLSAALVYAGGMKSQGAESIVTSVGTLFSVAVSIIILVAGLLKIQKVESN